MAEFKITKAFDGEVNALTTSAQAIHDSFVAASSDGVDTLSAAKAFIEEQAQIKALLTLYASLLEKDAKDLNVMIKQVRAMDEQIAATHK